MDRSLGDGNYYDLDDYAGFMRRLAVMFIDTTVLMLASVVLWIVMATVAWNIAPMVDPSGLFAVAWIAMLWAYLVPIKRSRIRTVAYRLLGLKIVTMKGERPSLLIMTVRMLMWSFGPVSFLFDLFWLGADTDRQSIRDCIVGTYVVRHNAEPLGAGPMHLARYTGAGLSLAYPRVCRPMVSHAE